jgi:molybdopterin molybdotransferase
MNEPSKNYPSGLTFKQARALVLETARQHYAPQPQVVDLSQALGRVLAANVVSRIDVPGFDNSAMDGYAIRFADVSPQGEGWFELLPVSFAGDAESVMDKPGQAVPIMTGAPLPLGADTVVPREKAEVKDNRVYLREVERKGQYVRKRAEDLRSGQQILPRGHRLRAQDLGLMASVGCARVVVQRPVQVSLFTGGDEIVQPGELPPDTPLPPGKIYDSVRPTLSGLLRQAGCEVMPASALPDDPEAIRQALQKAARPGQVIITTGGVSAGDKDFIRDVLLAHGRVIFYKVRMKPGYPLMLAELNGALVFALPGNPVSSFATFTQLVLPALRELAGENATTPLVCDARIDQKLSKNHYRREFVRARLRYEKGTGFAVSVCGNQSSGRLSSVTEANCFIVLDETPCELQAGDLVTVQRFCDLLQAETTA